MSYEQTALNNKYLISSSTTVDGLVYSTPALNMKLECSDRCKPVPQYKKGTARQPYAKTWAESAQEQRLLLLLPPGSSHFSA